MPEPQHPTKLILSFAKLAATPTETSWSQAYNAGNVFVCISLTTDLPDGETSLHAIGKELFNVLQSEFFTLEEKNITSIKTAIQTSLEQVPEQIKASLTLAFFKESTLLIFIAGSGKIIMKRTGKVGTLLSKQESTDNSITSASGFVANNDTIILETGQFAQNIPQEMISQALELDLPNDIVEALSPQIHKEDNGAHAAIVISCQGSSRVESLEEMEQDDNQTTSFLSSTPPPLQDQEIQSEDAPPISKETADEPLTEEYERESYENEPRKQFTLPTIPPFHFRFPFNHRRRLFLNIALIIVALLVISIFFTVKKYNDDKEQKLFQSIYPPAKQYYSEGKGLATVNASLSQDSFKKAQTLLQNGETKFNKGSSYYQQISDLLSQVNSSLQTNTTGQSTNATAIQPQSHSLLSVEQSTSSGLAFGQDTHNVYYITNDNITEVAKNDGTSNDIVKNSSYWSMPVAIVPYDGNIYVLDQKKGLLKFVAGGGGYGKSSYFKSGAPDLSSSTGMAIDGSVWLLFKDGTMMQYTKAVSNNLQISGLLKPMSNPTKIVTDINTENVYVLDSGNSRIVKFDKNGKYQNSYTSSVLSSAKDFTVDETNKKIDVLSQGKVWEINL